ncbi:hypothetical protein MH928_09435 [Flavobacterium sp. WW92]|uniref:hypothetical protein n=1 Tax=unclassified Flavobacterium TaxID=196869 RepID=UPI00222537FD|nr:MULTISPECIES: hypothetical protein [unclassified Flavobacterium]WDO11554.1 hypothetical protein MH928_09435 [Flavobacterium sp. WW92]
MKEIDILNQVNEFYNSAWEKLLVVGTIALTIVGIIAPIMMQWYQKRTLKLSEEHLREVLRKEIESSKIQLKEEIEALVNEKFKKSKNSLKRKSKILYNNSEGGLYFIQANNQMDDKKYYQATLSYGTAIDYYRKAKNFVSIQDILPYLVDCLKKIKKTDINELKKVDNVDLDKILTKVLNTDKYGVVRNAILEDIYQQYNYFK